MKALFLSALLLGQAALAAAPGLQLELQGVRLVPEQAANPGQAVAEVPSRLSLQLHLDGRYRVVNELNFPGGIRFQFEEQAGPEGGHSIDRLRWRNGIEQQAVPAEQARRTAAEFLFLQPALLLRQERRRVPDVDGHPAEQFTDPAGRTATLLFERPGGRLIEARSTPLRYRYEDAEGRALTVWNGERQLVRWQAEAKPLDPSASWQLPEGYEPAQARGPLRATALGEGVYRVDGTGSGYHLGFVVGREGVAVFDAPTSVDEGKTVRALIAETAPGLPIRHVVLSHNHRDHTAALPAYVEAGTQIWVGAGGRVALQRQHGAELAARAQAIDAPQTLDLGGRSLRLLPLASVHAQDMLLAYEPEAGVLFQGDMFYLPERGPVPPAFAVSVELAAAIERAGLKPRWIVGAHGRSGTLEELQQSLALSQRK